MKTVFKNLGLFVTGLLTVAQTQVFGQAGVPPTPYCFPLYSTLPCNQPGPSNTAGNFINDFINSFNTTGGVVNITNNNTGCNAQTFAGVGIRNYFYFGCTQYLQVTPGQNITCNFQSGNVYSQGCAVFVDWNQDGVFQVPAERVTGTPGVPAAATFAAMNFIVPAAQAAGTYRMRVRCAYATAGISIDPCINYGYGETEDYNLYVNTTPPGIITATASSNSPLCSGQSLNLTVSSSATVPLTYTWTGPSYTSTTQNPVIANAQASVSGVYSVVVSAGSCPVTKTVNVTVTNYPTYTLTPLTATVCQGGVFTPSVVLGTLPGTPCSTTGVVASACTSPNTITVGTGAAVNNIATYPAPYAKWWNDCHQQYLYTAAELNAAGVSGGYISSLAFNVTATNGAGTFPNYTIKMKCTNATTAASFDMTGLTTVYTNALLNPVVGWNTHTFGTPYFWDGTSNILVDICFNNGPWSVNCSSPYTTTPFVSCIYNYAIGGGSTCGTTGLMGTSSNRPNTRFTNCASTNPASFSYSWSPGPGIAAPTASSTAITAQPITGTVATVIYSVVVTPTVFSCPTIQTLTATIVNPASPTMTPVNPLCNTFGTVALTAVPGGGTWTTNSAVSAGGVLTPGLATIGTSTVLYSVGIGSCIATNTLSMEVSQFNSAAFTSSINPMCVTSPTVNLNSIVQSTVNGVWTGTNVIGTYSFNPAGLPTSTYALLYNTTSSPNPTVCPSSNTMVVSVLNPPQPVITQVGPYCNTAPTVQIVVSPLTGTWTPVTYQTPGGIFSPSLAAIGNNTVQYVIGTNTCNTQQTMTVNIEAFVPAVITGSIPDQCNTNSGVNLLPLTTNNLGTWLGSGIIGNVFDPSTSGTGNILLTYTTNSSPIGLCPDQATTAVNVYSLATPVITQVGPFCNTHGALQIPVTPIGGMFYTFNTSAINPNGFFAPSNAVIGNNIVSYSVTAGPCVAYAQTTISVEAFVSANLSSYAGPFCKNDPPINLNSIAQNPGGTWSGPAVVAGVFTPANGNVGNNNIITYQTFSSPTQSLCPDTSSIRIQVNDIPSVSIVSNGNKGCLPLEVIFNTPSVNDGVGTWNFGDGSPTETGLIATHMYSNPGSFTVSFTYADGIGCTTYTNLGTPINVYAKPVADFTFNPEEVTIGFPDVQFENHSTVLGDNTYQWQIGTMYQLNDLNPKVTFPTAGDYNITLIATTYEGCTDQITKVVYVKNDYGVYIPTSFTPNFDGKNDYFMPVFSPYGLDLKVYDLEIFDRWGHSLFHTKDFTQGWDGMAKGTSEPMKQDVYVYKIKFKDMDGKIHNKTGHVTLLK